MELLVISLLSSQRMNWLYKEDKMQNESLTLSCDEPFKRQPAESQEYGLYPEFIYLVHGSFLVYSLLFFSYCDENICCLTLSF